MGHVDQIKDPQKDSQKDPTWQTWLVVSRCGHGYVVYVGSLSFLLMQPQNRGQLLHCGPSVQLEIIHVLQASRAEHCWLWLKVYSIT